MTLTRIFALIALVALLGFYGVIFRFVPRVDLSIFIAIGVGLAAYDVWDQLGPGRRGR